MSEPFLGELRLFSFGFAPKGWALCDGQLLPISQFQALYSILGNAFGGDGRTTFALPNLQGRAPIHVGEGNPIGASGGQEQHTLSVGEMAQHTHAMQAKAGAADLDATGRSPGPTLTPAQAETGTTSAPTAVDIYSSSTTPDLGFAAGAVGTQGGSQPHENRQPFLAVNVCIALDGLYPPRN